MKVVHEIEDQQGFKGPVNCVRLSKNGEYFLSGGADKVVRLYNAKRGLKLAEYTGAGRVICSIAVADQNNFFISGGEDRVISYWDVIEKKVLRRFSGHFERIAALAMNSEGNVIISGSYDTKVRFWDVRGDSKKSLQILDEAKDSISSLTMVKDELIVTSLDGVARTYDFRAGKLREDEVFEAITGARVSNDEACLLLNCKDGILRLLDRETGDLLSHFTGHSNSNYAIECCFDSSDYHVISGSEDGTIYLWDITEGNVAETLKKHTHVVMTLDYTKSEQENILVSGGADGKVIVWNKV